MANALRDNKLIPIPFSSVVVFCCHAVFCFAEMLVALKYEKKYFYFVFTQSICRIYSLKCNSIYVANAPG